MNKRFDEQLSKSIAEMIDYGAETKDFNQKVKSFLQSEIDRAVAERDKEIADMMWQVREDWRNDGQIQSLPTADYLISLIKDK